MNLSNFYSEINPACLKNSFTKDEYRTISSSCNKINSTSLYNICTLLVDEPITYKEFYQEMKKHFYYDKYVCEHGTEFIYYVTFKSLAVHTRIPDDILYIVPAMR